MWAAMVKKDAPAPAAAPAPVAEPAVAPVAAAVAPSVNATPAEVVTSSAVAPAVVAAPADDAPRKRRVVVVDTAAIIKGVVFSSALGDSFVTVPEVVSEVRDVEARRRLDTMPVKLELRVPSKDSLLRVIQFANKTGDYAALSKVDVQVIALALQLHVESGGVVREAPIAQAMVYRPPVDAKTDVAVAAPTGGAAVVAPTSGEQKASVGPVVAAAAAGVATASSEDDENVDEDDEQQQQDGEWTEVGTESLQTDGDEDDDDDKESSSDWTTVSAAKGAPRSGAFAKPAGELPGWGTGEWATAADVAAMRSKSSVVEAPVAGEAAAGSAEWAGVACLTSDFAMQNVLLHMGLRVSTIEGRRITRVKQWALRCFSCYKITRDMTRVFCPTCGNNTLKRVSISVDAQGTVMAFLNPKYKISTRGTKYTIPKPTGGRGPKFITDEAQLPKVKHSKATGTEEYGFADPRNRPAEKPVVEWGGKNPHEHKRTGKKKKNRNKVVN